MRAQAVCLMAMSCLISTASAQPGSSMLPAFDAASVKANRSGSDGGSMQVAKGSLAFSDVPLVKIVAAAFGISEDREAYLLAGPGWMGAERYDLVARFPAPTSAGQMRLMLQAMLTERFGMRFHRETRDVPAYALVVAKGGLKARTAAEGSAGGFRRGPGHLESKSATMSLLADKLSPQSDRLVVDKTEVRGSYEFAIDWTPDELQNNGRAGISLFTAIEEQAGLKLEARKEPMEVVVVDFIEKIPSEN